MAEDIIGEIIEKKSDKVIKIIKQGKFFKGGTISAFFFSSICFQIS